MALSHFYFENDELSFKEPKLKESNLAIISKMGSSNNGFALAIMVPLLPVLLGVALASYGALTLLQLEQRFSYTCRSGGIIGQEKAGKQITSLLKLNPKALKLILQERLAQKRVVAAGLSGNGAAIATAMANLKKIHLQQQALSIQQKQIITQGNLHLRQAQTNTGRQLRELALGLNSYNSLFHIQPRTEMAMPPRLAVSPETTDIAPTYRTDPDIEERQQLVQRWQYRISVQRYLGSFLNGNFQFKKSCAVAVTERNQSWVPKIPKDKF